MTAPFRNGAGGHAPPQLAFLCAEPRARQAPERDPGRDASCNRTVRFVAQRREDELTKDLEVLSAPVSAFELVLAYVGAAASKSIILGLVILATANLFVPVTIAHPVWMVAFLVLTATSFCLFGFILGIWADGFDQLQFIPMLVITPLTFLGGAFYSIGMLPAAWQTFSLFNPIVYLISGFRWSFYSVADVSIGISLAMTLAFLVACIVIIWRIFATGYRLKT